MELPLDEDAVEDDILADLIAGLHHYADSRGIGFDSAVASGQAAYERHRAGEDNPYRIGDEVHLRQRPDTGFPGRGVVVSIFPERDGEPSYHVRFPGQADATPLRGREIGPAAAFPAVTTNQGTAASLAAAERLLIETAARIRACEQRQVPPHDHDLADKDSLLLAIGNACALAGSDVLRHLEPQVAAWTDVITQPWHPVHVTSATELAALDFPQPVQASVLADAPERRRRPAARRTPPGPKRRAGTSGIADLLTRRKEDRHANYRIPQQRTGTPTYHEREREMSHPDPRHLAEANGAYPYELPVHDSAITGTGTGMPGADTRQHEEWHHAEPPPRGAGGWDATREFGPPPDWTDEGVFIAGDDDGQHGWDTGPASPTPPYGTPRRHPARRLPARLIATTALVILCITAITFVMFPRNHTIRIAPADNPAATASQPTPGVRSGGTTPAAAEPAALTKADAERILASYWQVNNTANESRSDTLLKTVEAGSSYSMDAGTYQMDRVTDPANRQYTAFTAENATYYIPRQPAGVYPRWFVARVTYANLAAPQHATGAGYVLFTQAAMNAPWKNDLEPYMLPGTGPGPFIETDSHGYAIAASASDEAGLSVTSAQIQEATAESLDSSSATVKNPGNLADLRDEAYFCGKLPAGSTDTDKHSTSGRVFALKTVGGGVLAFYALTAQLTLAPPPGQTFQVSIPGFYSSSQTLTSATIDYAEQFATYIPPDQASPQILADASGITGRE